MTFLQSWIPSANDPASDFPPENLPFGVFSMSVGGYSASSQQIGVAIGDQVLNVSRQGTVELFEGKAREIAVRCKDTTLNGLMSAPSDMLSDFRKRVQELVCSTDSATIDKVSAALVPMEKTIMSLPATIGDYTDFYASIEHATNVGSMFRPDNPLLPNYKHVPIGYHGRSSSIVVSGSVLRRPRGQTMATDASAPVFGPSRSLDYEAEIGFFVARGNDRGKPIPIDEAENHIFGFCLLNDWSARDIQAWEYQPLGPFLAKNFTTTISPWVVTREALAPFRAPRPVRAHGDPEALPYLQAKDSRSEALDLQVEVLILSQKMRDQGIEPHRVSRAGFRSMYWTPAQMLTHHASGGCNMRTGDLIGSGTVSGTTKDSRGSMLELTWRGAEPLALPSGETRKFLEDGDEVIMRGYCEREGVRRIGFGECRGTILPAGS
ncbi:MAG: fumarylacetoacetase [Gemmatimonadaceae bacterium]|nr:fumarylacetoacetase [Gemmatimonadaceae bacterium]